MFNRNMLYRGVAAALLISASTSLHADIFSVSLTGVIDYEGVNAYGLAAGESISAVGTFTAASDFLTAGSSTGSFSGLSIDLNGTIFTLLDASATPTITFQDGELFDFNYTSTAIPGFNSSGLFFDNIYYEFGPSMVGTWTTAAVALVPEAETYAMMLAGLGLVGFMGAARRKKLQAAA